MALIGSAIKIGQRLSAAQRHREDQTRRLPMVAVVYLTEVNLTRLSAAVALVCSQLVSSSLCSWHSGRRYHSFDFLLVRTCPVSVASSPQPKIWHLGRD